MSTYIVTLPVPKSQRIKYICLKTFLSLNMVYSYGKEARGIPSPNKNKTFPLCQAGSPVFVPLIASQQGIHEKPYGQGTSRSRSRELFLIVSLVFGAAHCAMRNSRKLRTKCNCSTLVYTAAVYLGNPQKASLLWEEEQPNISYQTRKTLCGLNM